MAETLARLDPDGAALKIEMTLEDRDASEEKGAFSPASKPDADAALSEGTPARDTLSAGMLDSIGAIVTSQAAISAAFAELSENGACHA